MHSSFHVPEQTNVRASCPRFPSPRNRPGAQVPCTRLVRPPPTGRTRPPATNTSRPDGRGPAVPPEPPDRPEFGSIGSDRRIADRGASSSAGRVDRGGSATGLEYARPTAVVGRGRAQSVGPGEADSDFPRPTDAPAPFEPRSGPPVDGPPERGRWSRGPGPPSVGGVFYGRTWRYNDGRPMLGPRNIVRSVLTETWMKMFSPTP